MPNGWPLCQPNVMLLLLCMPIGANRADFSTIGRSVNLLMLWAVLASLSDTSFALGSSSSVHFVLVPNSTLVSFGLRVFPNSQPPLHFRRTKTLSSQPLELATPSPLASTSPFYLWYTSGSIYYLPDPFSIPALQSPHPLLCLCPWLGLRTHILPMAGSTMFLDEVYSSLLVLEAPSLVSPFGVL